MSSSGNLASVADAQPPFYLGIDLGGTNVKIGLVDDLGQTVGYRSIATESERGADDAVHRMAQVMDEILRDTGLSRDDVARVGLGSPGTMDLDTGRLLQPHNLPGFFDYPIRDRLADACRKPTTFANDGTAAAYGEFWRGSGRNFNSLVMLTLGTGIGCGIIIGGLTIDGEHSHGAECGHIIIDCQDTARICACGARGHLEAYASANGVIAQTKEAVNEHPHSSLAVRKREGVDLTPLVVAQEAEAGDDLARQIVMDTARYLGIGIVSLVHTIDPDGVVLGGGMTFGGGETALGRSFLDAIRSEFRERAFPVLAERVAIEFSVLGGDAGYIGAAGLARKDASNDE